MKFNEITAYIKEFFDKPSIFSEAQETKIKNAISVMINDVESMINDEQIETTEEKFKEVLDTVLLISNSVLENAISNELSKFVTVLSELTYNWNANTYKDEVLKQLAMHISRTVETRNLLLSNTAIMKDVEERMRDLSGWTPPAYEIATSYLEKLLEESK